MKKLQIRCNDCGFKFFAEDTEYCIHHKTEGIGSKECPQCHNCICHGQTADEIFDRFNSNIAKGKFVPVKDKDWDYQCITNKEVEV